MTAQRFEFQRSCLSSTFGYVLNVGSYDDPAQLKQMAPDRVLNCDLVDWSGVDVVMDCRGKWPFKDDFAELVIMGDIIEHLYYNEALGALTEAHRVSQKLCITVPHDSRWETDGIAVDEHGGRTHCYTWSREELEKVLEDAGWKIDGEEEVDYGFVPTGWFVSALRQSRHAEMT